MMKGFLKFSKLMGLMLLASGLVFAGCAQPGGNEEDAVAGGNGGFMIPITVNTSGSELTMEIGDGAGMAVGTWSGHQVGLANAAPCSGPALAATCTVRVTNLDPNYYMANTFISLSYCGDCDGSQTFSNADLSNGVTVFAAGGDASINGADYCVVEDGKYVGYPAPYAQYGCTTVSTKGDPKPLQFIHPDCGTRDVKWDFATASGTNFRFYANIAADWFPEVPLADPRFDFQNRTTYYLTLNSLQDDKIAAMANKVWWRFGSYKRSSTHTGYGSGGGDYTPLDPAKKPVGQKREYFALNVLLEAPDRMEQHAGMGYYDGTDLPDNPVGPGMCAACFDDYEYYTSISWVVRYDPTVIKAAGTGTTTGAKVGTNIYAGGLSLCNSNLSSAHCDKRKPTFTGLDPITSTTNFGDLVSEPYGWLFSYSAMPAGKFTWNGIGADYQFTNGAIVKGGYAGIWPVHAGHVGFVKVNPVVATATYPITNWNATTAMIANGTPDPEPELGLGMYYFKLQSGTAGKGTQLYVDHWATENGPLINWTAGTAHGGFNGAASDDWTAVCIPINASYNNPTDQGCGPFPAYTIADYFVYGQTESSNPLIRHSGMSVPNRGGFQYWNVHLCVL